MSSSCYTILPTNATSPTLMLYPIASSYTVKSGNRIPGFPWNLSFLKLEEPIAIAENFAHYLASFFLSLAWKSFPGSSEVRFPMLGNDIFPSQQSRKSVGRFRAEDSNKPLNCPLPGPAQLMYCTVHWISHHNWSQLLRSNCAIKSKDSEVPTSACAAEQTVLPLDLTILQQPMLMCLLSNNPCWRDCSPAVHTEVSVLQQSVLPLDVSVP